MREQEDFTSLANALKDEGFTVVSVCPGWVDTDMGSRSDTKEVRPMIQPICLQGLLVVSVRPCWADPDMGSRSDTGGVYIAHSQGYPTLP